MLQLTMKNNTDSQEYAIKLRQWYLSDGDEEAFRQLVRRADHRFTDGYFPEVYTSSCEYRWIKGMVDCMYFGDDLHYAVEVDGKVIGCANLSRCGGDYSHTAVLRLVLLPEACGHGIGTRVVSQIILNVRKIFFSKDAVTDNSVERIEAYSLGENKAAERVLEKNGFVYEGTIRNAVIKNGRTYDQKVFGYIVREHYLPDMESMPENKNERIKLNRDFLQES